MIAPLPRLSALRYVQPLREGGSLPAVVDTESGLFVVKFRGAGQGPRALAAEILVAGLAGGIGLPVPELALVELSADFGRTEPDPEIQELLRRSHGVNVGLRYLDGAFNFDPRAAGDLLPPPFAPSLVWLDAFTTNPDRTHRNPNLLVWQRRPYLIDHGSALYAHHAWASAQPRSPFDRIRDHVLLAAAGELAQVDAALAARIEPVIDAAVAALPHELLEEPARERERYRSFLHERLRAPREFVAEAVAARERVLAAPPVRRPARR